MSKLSKVKLSKGGGKKLTGGNQVCPPGVLCLENTLIIIILLFVLIINTWLEL